MRITHFEKQSELVRPTLLEALFPKVRAEVLCLLFTNAGQELYVRQLAQRLPKREIGVSQQILTVGDEKSPNNKSNRELGSDLLTFDILSRSPMQSLPKIKVGDSVNRRYLRTAAASSRRRGECDFSSLGSKMGSVKKSSTSLF